jgi:nucleoid DNA-binding protein
MLQTGIVILARKSKKTKTIKDVVENMMFDGKPRQSVPCALRKQADAQSAFVMSVLNEILTELPEHSVRAPNFGTFYCFEGAEFSRNPKTGETVKVKDRKQVKFSMSAKAKMKFNK